ncbi:hypothetical protein [Lutibacter sp. A64]|nr:hypothetical protein [Lutibacter sp. A64]
MQSLVEHTKNGVYNLPDGTQRFLLTKELLNNIKSNKNISLIRIC